MLASAVFVFVCCSWLRDKALRRASLVDLISQLDGCPVAQAEVKIWEHSLSHCEEREWDKGKYGGGSRTEVNTGGVRQ